MLFGKTILITGVSSGIGARTAELAAQLGADVIGVEVHQGVKRGVEAGDACEVQVGEFNGGDLAGR